MNKILSSICWMLFAVYLYFSYQLLVIPALLDFSLYGLVAFLLVSFILLWLTPTGERRKMLIFGIAFLLLDKAYYETSYYSFFPYLFSLIVITLVIGFIAFFYGKLAKHVVFAMIGTALLLHLLIPRDEAKALNHFWIQWKSPPLYLGEMFDYFPLLIRDINNDGKDELITLGNRDETLAKWKEENSGTLSEEKVKEKLEEERIRSRYPFLLKPEELFLYAFTLGDGKMERIPVEKEQAQIIMAEMIKDYIGFPYYTMTSTGIITPQIQRQPLVEGMMQIGTSPFRAMLLDANAISQILVQSNGAFDAQNGWPDSAFSEVSIVGDELRGIYNGDPFRIKTEATTILGPVKMSSDQESLLLLGNSLELVGIENGTPRVTHQLTNEQIKNLSTSQFIIGDVNRDGSDEILVSSEQSRILKPTKSGTWEILWAATDESFRFEDFTTVGGENQKEIVALGKSEVRQHPLRYLTGYTMEKDVLKREWRTFLSFINVRGADVDGDGKKELVASMYRTHRIYVLSKHNIPVELILLATTVFLAIIAGYRRFRRHGL
ncbi:hypothetical protein L1765_01065 [Microaerobacter geothermalis]|uniref:hypothetical protein n=1 Tax=Microaerobacter geothermalis TaxID=674972 RepID=UPI001F3B5B0A|nr:hypothetical protein [Microaerobacter geothermalis]MCF6092583.1 hypothetical protein [Microaerobacter geothermalis]